MWSAGGGKAKHGRRVRRLGVALLAFSTVVLGAGPAAAEATPSSAALVTVGDAGAKTVTLTFDAGSDAGDATKILDILAAQHITASFSLTGRFVELFPDVAARVVRDGHQPVNHSYDHPDLTTLTQSQRWSQLDRTEAIFKAHGFTGAGWFRPPYGARNASVDRDLALRGYYIDLMWTVDTLGWEGVPTTTVVNRVLADLRPGEIILMHVGAAATDAEALPSVISAIRARGYGFASPAQALSSGAIGKRYDALGAQKSVLGVPRTVLMAEAGGWVQWFQGGRLYWSSATGAHRVAGAILTKYRALGGPASYWKFPTADEAVTGDGHAYVSVFQRGRIYWSAATGAHEVHGAILTRYLALGAASSRLGLPRTDEYATSYGARSDFEHGYIRWTRATGVVQVVYG